VSIRAIWFGDKNSAIKIFIAETNIPSNGPRPGSKEAAERLGLNLGPG